MHTLRFELDRDVDGLLHAVDVRGEGRDEDPALPEREDLPEGLADDSLRRREAGTLRVRRVAEHEVDAKVPDLREAADVRLQTVDRGVVELVVAGVHDPARGRLEHDRDGVRNRVRHADERDAERPDLSGRVVRVHLAKLRGTKQAVLVELRLDEAEREPRGPDLGNRHLAHQVRQRADMILVAVREDDRPDLVGVLAQVARSPAGRGRRRGARPAGRRARRRRRRSSRRTRRRSCSSRPRPGPRGRRSCSCQPSRPSLRRRLGGAVERPGGSAGRPSHPQAAVS